MPCKLVYKKFKIDWTPLNQIWKKLWKTLLKKLKISKRVEKKRKLTIHIQKAKRNRWMNLNIQKIDSLLSELATISRGHIGMSSIKNDYWSSINIALKIYNISIYIFAFWDLIFNIVVAWLGLNEWLVGLFLG